MGSSWWRRNERWVDATGDVLSTVKGAPSFDGGVKTGGGSAGRMLRWKELVKGYFSVAPVRSLTLLSIGIRRIFTDISLVPLKCTLKLLWMLYKLKKACFPLKKKTKCVLLLLLCWIYTPLLTHTCPSQVKWAPLIHSELRTVTSWTNQNNTASLNMCMYTYTYIRKEYVHNSYLYACNVRELCVFISSLCEEIAGSNPDGQISSSLDVFPSWCGRNPSPPPLVVAALAFCGSR